MSVLNATPPHVVYHVAGMGNWKDVVNEQLLLLRESGLHGTDVRVTYLGDEENWLRGRLKDFQVNAEIVFSDNNLAHCETVAMIEVETLAKKENTTRPILYFHTKGVSNPGDWCKQQWRHLMQEHVIRQWRINLMHLRDHDAVGVNWIEWGTQHFSGTFWIATPEWIRRLPPFREYHHKNGLHRYTCEMWIGAAEWCRAKSLACKNEPFWNAWYDFGRLLPPTTPGSFDYRGTAMHQPVKILDVLPPILKELAPARVLEIGTGEGGFIRFVRHTLNDLGMKAVPTLSIDVTHRDQMLVAKKEESTLWTLQTFSPGYTTIHDDVAAFIQQEGRTLIFCDGASPAKEFAALAPVAKLGDVLFAHDYAPTADYFNEHIKDKVWNWLETTDSMLAPAVERYQMSRIKPEELQTVVWCGYVKTDAGKIGDLSRPPVPGKVGLGVLTYKRPDYFSRCIESVKAAIDQVDAVYVYNDGSPGTDYFPIYATLPEKVRVCHADRNRGVSAGKNHLLNAMLDDGCEFIFLMEDDIVIKDPGVFQAYIRAHIPGKIEHLNFAHHGPANAAGPVEHYNGKIDLFPQVVGAFSFYTSNVLRSVGVMDTGFKNCWEHVEHTARVAAAKLTTPFWKFADLVSSTDYLGEQPEAIENSSIRGVDGWSENKEYGMEYWRTKLSTPYPL